MCFKPLSYVYTEKEKVRKIDTVAGKIHLKALSLIFKHGARADIQKEAEGTTIGIKIIQTRSRNQEQ